MSLFFWNPIKVLGSTRAAAGMMLLIAALFIAGDILFNIFLQRLAEYVDDKQSASSASGVRILRIVVFVLIAFMGLMLGGGGFREDSGGRFQLVGRLDADG